ncbi:3-phosphoshikimate 1-carboxyvinyltransferase [Bacteroidota bacterium]
MNNMFTNVNRIYGTLNLPGDKSISHRAVMFSAMAKGESIIYNSLRSDDINSTIKCFANLGCEINQYDDVLKVKGVGFRGFREPEGDLDCGNSGTTARLISGILSAQNFKSCLIGDPSLSVRPMKRIVNPLSRMGANIQPSEKGTLPLQIFPSESLHAIEYELEVPSAQVKSAVLLAGIHLSDKTVVIEPIVTRDHTENLLNLRIEVESGKRKIYSSSDNYPEPKKYFVPSDVSTASFFICLALLIPNSELIIKNISLNKSRTGALDLFRLMGGRIEISDIKTNNGEAYGDLVIKNSSLKNIEIDETVVPNLIDEIPILSVVGLFSDGEFTIRNANELRVKESDRINSLCYNYRMLGLDVEEYNDGFTVSGEIKNSNVKLKSFGDHRIAMSMSILAIIGKLDLTIDNIDCVSVSNPQFFDQVESISK